MFQLFHVLLDFVASLLQNCPTTFQLPPIFGAVSDRCAPSYRPEALIWIQRRNINAAATHHRRDNGSLYPNAQGPLRYVNGYGIRTAGAESNVAVGLTKLGIEAAWLSRLGQDEFGVFIRNQLRAEGVDCSHVIFDSQHRTGIMFKETGVGKPKYSITGKTAPPAI